MPELRKKGADLVVALSHGGLDAAPYTPKMENAGLYLASAGIDALMLGHAHLIFPQAKEADGPRIDPSFSALPASQVDTINGFVNGVPAVMAQSAGRRLGIINLELQYHGNKWVVQKDQTSVEARGFKFTDGQTVVDADPAVASLIADEHSATIAYARQPLGVAADYEMSTYFAMVGDASALDIVSQAQIDYVKNFIAGSNDPALARYKKMPVISCSAPLKGGRNGPTDFTDVAPGAAPSAPVELQVRNPGDLYLYGSNELQAVRIDGADLRNWLETAARQFAQIDPDSAIEQDLVPSYAGIYHFDVFYAENNALQYQIDVTQPPGKRIKNLTYEGRAIADGDEFIVATNDYRAGGGDVPGLDGSKTIIKSPDANREIVTAYLKRQGRIVAAESGAARSWSFARVAVKGPVTMRSAPGKLALAQRLGLKLVKAEGPVDASGFAKYFIDLND